MTPHTLTSEISSNRYSFHGRHGQSGGQSAYHYYMPLVIITTERYYLPIAWHTNDNIRRRFHECYALTWEAPHLLPAISSFTSYPVKHHISYQFIKNFFPILKYDFKALLLYNRSFFVWFSKTDKLIFDISQGEIGFVLSSGMTETKKYLATKEQSEGIESQKRQNHKDEQKISFLMFFSLINLRVWGKFAIFAAKLKKS